MWTRGFGLLVLMALLVDWFPSRRGTAVASYNSCRFLGGLVGPLTIGALADLADLPWGFAAGAFLLLATLGASLACRRSSIVHRRSSVIRHPSIVAPAHLCYT